MRGEKAKIWGKNKGRGRRFLLTNVNRRSARGRLSTLFPRGRRNRSGRQKRAQVRVWDGINHGSGTIANTKRTGGGEGKKSLPCERGNKRSVRNGSGGGKEKKKKMCPYLPSGQKEKGKERFFRFFGGGRKKRASRLRRTGPTQGGPPPKEGGRTFIVRSDERGKNTHKPRGKGKVGTLSSSTGRKKERVQRCGPRETKKRGPLVLTIALPIRRKGMRKGGEGTLLTLIRSALGEGEGKEAFGDSTAVGKR